MLRKASCHGPSARIRINRNRIEATHIGKIRHPVKSAEEAVRLTENTKDKVTLLRIWTNGGSHYVVVDESKAG